MRSFGRQLTANGLPRGGPMPIEAMPLPRYPTISPASITNALEMPMRQRGAIHAPPTRPIFTQSASGGCVPVCACGITPPRTVDWIYLMHGHGGNPPLNVTTQPTNPQHIYICMMVYSGASSVYAATEFQGYYFEALDPNDVIPANNALLIFGDYTKLVITRQGMVAVNIE